MWLRHSLGVKRRFRRQLIQRLDEPKTSMLVHRRLILRRSVAVIDFNPSIIAAKGDLMSTVVFVVHADLGHHGLLHSLDGVPASRKLRCDSNQQLHADYCEHTKGEGADVDVEDVPGKGSPQERQTACMISNGSWGGADMNPASPTATAAASLNLQEGQRSSRRRTAASTRGKYKIEQRQYVKHAAREARDRWRRANRIMPEEGKRCM
jgi:hypothetical protein